MSHIEIEGHSFYYFEKEGVERTVMLLCSTGLDSRQWSDLLPMLKGRKIICPHYLCYPGTDNWKGDGEIDPWYDYLAAETLLLAENKPIDIIGHSYGGFIALKLAKKYPEKIRKIATHEPIVWGCLQFTEKEDLRDEFGEVTEKFFTENLDPEDFIRDFVDYWNNTGTWDSMPEERKKMWMNLQPKILSEARMLCYDKTPVSFYESIQHPILITLSKETPLHQYEACKIVASSLKNVRLVDVPGGHMGVVTKSEAVMPFLAEWIL
ncbi:MAG: alpha/beta fold hydrolase [Candidatus Thalassarchaeaceae archaeon]